MAHREKDPRRRFRGSRRAVEGNRSPWEQKRAGPGRGHAGKPLRRGGRMKRSKLIPPRLWRGAPLTVPAPPSAPSLNRGKYAPGTSVSAFLRDRQRPVPLPHGRSHAHNSEATECPTFPQPSPVPPSSSTRTPCPLPTRVIPPFSFPKQAIRPQHPHPCEPKKPIHARCHAAQWPTARRRPLASRLPPRSNHGKIRKARQKVRGVAGVRRGHLPPSAPR